MNVDAEITDGALDLHMAEQDLDGPQVTRRLVDDRRLGATERVGAVVLRLQPNAGDPFANHAGTLS